MPYLVGGVTEGQISGMSGSRDDLYEIANAAVLGRLNYTYNDRYIVEGQFRCDGSSRVCYRPQVGLVPFGISRLAYIGRIVLPVRFNAVVC